jgi:glucose-1-phosphate adenylyltransferase
MNRVLAIIMAGGAGERLQPLTRGRSKAAVPFGGKFRLIDFTLSNCVNSGLRRVYVLTQYRSGSLNRHIQDGWGLSISGLGDFIYCVPAQQQMGAEWYLGTADAVRQNLNLVKIKDFDYILILSGDHIYKMNYVDLINFHQNRKAALTIAAVKVPKEQAAGRLGVLESSIDDRLIGFAEKPFVPKVHPSDPKVCLGSMGVYIFRSQFLLEALKHPGVDFGKHIIPALIGGPQDIYIYDYELHNIIEDVQTEVRDGVRYKVNVNRTQDSSYWKDVGTIDSYYDASMDLVGINPLFNLYGEKWLFRTYMRPLPPSKFVLGGRALESIVSEGCIISGASVWNSIISPNVIMERDAVVEQSVIFDDVVVEPGARIRRAIIDKECRIRVGARIGFNTEEDRKRGLTISEGGVVVVPKSADIA